LRGKFITKLEGAKHINGGEGSNGVFLESGNGTFCGIDPMVVRGNELDVDCFGPDVLLNCGGTLVVHHVKRRMVASSFQYRDYFGECLYHGSISARGHGLDDDCIEIVYVGNKHILHTFERADREGTGNVGIHGASYGIGKRGKTEHILHSTDFLRGKHLINLGMHGNNVGLHIAHRGCVGLVPVHVSLSLVVEHGRWFLINVGVRPGMVVSSSLRSSAPRSIDAGREHMIWWMQWAYLAVKEVASILEANAEVGVAVGSAWLVVVGLAALSPVFLVRGTIHKPVWVHLLPQMMMQPR
jgi:hypothetical protein